MVMPNSKGFGQYTVQGGSQQLEFWHSYEDYKPHTEANYFPTLYVVIIHRVACSIA